MQRAARVLAALLVLATVLIVLGRCYQAEATVTGIHEGAVAVTLADGSTYDYHAIDTICKVGDSVAVVLDGHGTANVEDDSIITIIY